MTTLSGYIDRVQEAIGTRVARWRGWSAIGQRVIVQFGESGDPALFGKRVRGWIRGTAVDGDRPTNTLIELADPLDYRGHYVHLKIMTVVTRPRYRWHGVNRLLIASATVFIIDARTFDEAIGPRVIGIGVLSVE